MLALLGMGGTEMLVIFGAILLLFGSKKLPELAKGLGQGIREFKKASNEVTSEFNRSIEDDHEYTPPPKKTPPEGTAAHGSQEPKSDSPAKPQ